MRYFFTLLCYAVGLVATAQNTAIGNNEKLTFSASYNMSGLLTEIAQVVMETSEVKTSNSTLLKLKCTAATYSSFDSYFKIRDLYESYVSPTTLTPYLYKRDINEGSYYKFEQYKFNHKSKSVSSTMKKRKSEENKTVSIGSNTRDIVSTIYHIRNLDISQASPGDAQNFTFLFDNEELVINVKYLRKETINTNLGKKECYKLAVSLKNDDALKGTNENLLWLTADGNKLPVYAKFKIAVGTGELKLKSATGLKN
ncbi:DUF3108 domain-containing protein [Subsaxibacter sp. CAU 1640]|uniref:DUF3108 domain-containing protein n=1 Tax=Subsaxibacter sp. CAU 1640 TaxID=2933271 RepID=UPI0020040705|nr:DUF3108 domain-containing protein [Subsaxibacter sp. CAU 1640]MCK7590782.1 DUF3108 domain-containing protein [Subsaxibacter sp. CAU 1640]